MVRIVLQNARHGAWGSAIFSDVIASDIRADYRNLLEDGVADAEAERRIIAE